VVGVGGDRPDVAFAGRQHAEVTHRAGRGDVLPHSAVRVGARVERAVGRGRQAPDETAAAAEGVQVRDLAGGDVEAVEVGHRVGADVDLAAGDRGGPAALGLPGGRAVGEGDAPDDLAGGQVDVRQDGRLQAAGDDVGVALVDGGADDGSGHRGRAVGAHGRSGALPGHGGHRGRRGRRGGWRDEGG
jgi:hypothetical protein